MRLKIYLLFLIEQKDFILVLIAVVYTYFSEDNAEYSVIPKLQNVFLSRTKSNDIELVVNFSQCHNAREMNVSQTTTHQ